MNIQTDEYGIFSNRKTSPFIVITCVTEKEQDEIFEMVKGFARASKHDWSKTLYTEYSVFGNYAIILTGNTQSGINIAEDWMRYSNYIQEWSLEYFKINRKQPVKQYPIYNC